MTGVRVFLLGVLLGALRVPASALLGEETMTALDEIVKVGAACGVLYSAWRYVLRPAAALTTAKVQRSRALTAAVHELPEHQRAVVKRLDSIDARLERGAVHMRADREAIERIEQHLDLPARDAV